MDAGPDGAQKVRKPSLNGRVVTSGPAGSGVRWVRGTAQALGRGPAATPSSHQRDGYDCAPAPPTPRPATGEHGQGTPLWGKDAQWSFLPAGGGAGPGKVPDARRGQRLGRSARRAQRQFQIRALDPRGCAEGFTRLEHIFKRPAGVVDRLWRPDPTRGGGHPRQQRTCASPAIPASPAPRSTSGLIRGGPRCSPPPAGHGFGLERPVRRGCTLVPAQGYLPQIVLVQIDL
jgi:hypothetical protein